MSTAQSTASPRAPRGKQTPQSPALASQNTASRQSQRKPRGNRAQNQQYNGSAPSPSKLPPGVDPAFADGTVIPNGASQIPTGPRVSKKHTYSQPSIDRVFSPGGLQTSLTDSEAAPNNPSATPAKNQGAYAGPTFHASPAPSALPIPKFLSRSVPAKTRSGPPTPPPEDSSDSGGSPSSFAASPSRAPIPVPPRNEDSPLDMLFKAHKAERAKNVNGSPASTNIFQPPQQIRPSSYKQDSYNSGNGVFPIELDGESRDPSRYTPSAVSPGTQRSVTDPNKVPQVKDASLQGTGNDVMQDLMNRLSMSQKKTFAATPPRSGEEPQSGSQARQQTPSPFHDGTQAVRSVSGPSTPQPTNQEAADFFYGNKNLSPMFKAAKGDSSKRNSGLRTEITADSPMVGQGMFQDFPSMAPAEMMKPNIFARDQPARVVQEQMNTRRGSAPFIQPYQQSPDNRRKTPGRQQHYSRPDTFSPPRGNMRGSGHRGGRNLANAPPVSAPKPSTTMMSFVPASVSAKQHSTSAPPSSGGPPPVKAPSLSDTLALEQDLKRMLNLGTTGATPGVR